MPSVRAARCCRCRCGGATLSRPEPQPPGRAVRGCRGRAGAPGSVSTSIAGGGTGSTCPSDPNPHSVSQQLALRPLHPDARPSAAASVMPNGTDHPGLRTADSPTRQSRLYLHSVRTLGLAPRPPRTHAEPSRVNSTIVRIGNQSPFCRSVVRASLPQEAGAGVSAAPGGGPARRSRGAGTRRTSGPRSSTALRAGAASSPRRSRTQRPR